jgi:hypothetical protein
MSTARQTPSRCDRRVTKRSSVTTEKMKAEPLTRRFTLRFHVRVSRRGQG